MEGVRGAAVVQVVAHGGDNECQGFQGGEDFALHQLQVLQHQEGEVGDRESVQPVVVRRVPVTFAHH